MKAWFLISMLTVGAAQAARPADVADLEVDLEIDTSDLYSLEPLIARVTVRNVSEEAVVIREPNNFFGTLIFEYRQPDMPRMVALRYQNQPLAEPVGKLRLAPSGEVARYEVIASLDHESPVFKKPGKYGLRAMVVIREGLAARSESKLLDVKRMSSEERKIFDAVTKPKMVHHLSNGTPFFSPRGSLLSVRGGPVYPKKVNKLLAKMPDSSMKTKLRSIALLNLLNQAADNEVRRIYLDRLEDLRGRVDPVAAGFLNKAAAVILKINDAAELGAESR